MGDKNNKQNRNIRVVIILAELKSGGQAQAMCALARGLMRRGHAVTILSLEELSVSGKFNGLDIRYVGETRVTRAFFCVGRMLRSLTPDLVLTASVQINLLGIVCTRLWCPSAKIIVTEHSMPLWQIQFAPSLKIRLLKLGQQALYWAADWIVAASQPVGGQLGGIAGIPAKRISVIGYSVLNPELLALAALPPTHPWLASKRGPVVIALGHLILRKGFANLIKAFAEVRKQSQARLVIFGEGNQRTQLEALVAEHGLGEAISLPGNVLNPYPEIMAADVVVSSALEEAAPLTPTEAICLGVPVVATNALGGTADILGHGRYGRLVSVEAPGEMASAILETLRENAGCCWNPGAERYKEENIIDQWEQLVAMLRRTTAMAH